MVFATPGLPSPSFKHVRTSVDVAHRIGFPQPTGPGPIRRWAAHVPSTTNGFRVHVLGELVVTRDVEIPCFDSLHHAAESGCSCVSHP